MTSQPLPEQAPAADPASGPAPEADAIGPLGVIRILYAAGEALMTQAALHGELVRIELAEQKKRLLQMLACILLGFVGALCVLLLVAALVLAFSWNTGYRIPVAIGLVVVYGIGTGLAVWRLRTLSVQSSQAFAASREELAADLAMLRSRM